MLCFFLLCVQFNKVIYLKLKKYIVEIKQLFLMAQCPFLLLEMKREQLKLLQDIIITCL